jgi:hypothetical protein
LCAYRLLLGLAILCLALDFGLLRGQFWTDALLPLLGVGSVWILPVLAMRLQHSGNGGASSTWYYFIAYASIAIIGFLSLVIFAMLNKFT